MDSVKHAKQLGCLYYPTTRYYGSKRRLLPWIEEIASGLSFDSVFDRFGGTASVSLLFNKMGKKVFFYDALESNRYSAKALLSYPQTFNKKKIINFFTSVKPTKGVVTENFSELYYSREEDMWLDGAVQKINLNKSTSLTKSYLWYCLFQACLKKRPFNAFHRANYYLRTANVSRSFGNLSTWNKSFLYHIEQAAGELELLFDNCKNNLIDNKVIKSKRWQDYSEKIDADLIYLDPPYVKDNNYSDDYFKRYHFLEGLLNYDNWENLIDAKVKTKSIPTPEKIKNWHKKSHFKELLFDEIKKYRDKKVMLSYQTEGYPNIDSIYDFFVSQFAEVHIYKSPLSHALSKYMKTEVIIVGIP